MRLREGLRMNTWMLRVPYMYRATNRRCPRRIIPNITTAQNTCVLHYHTFCNTQADFKDGLVKHRWRASRSRAFISTVQVTRDVFVSDREDEKINSISHFRLRRHLHKRSTSRQINCLLRASFGDATYDGGVFDSNTNYWLQWSPKQGSRSLDLDAVTHHLASAHGSTASSPLASLSMWRCQKPSESGKPLLRNSKEV